MRKRERERERWEAVPHAELHALRAVPSCRACRMDTSIRGRRIGRSLYIADAPALRARACRECALCRMEAGCLRCCCCCRESASTLSLPNLRVGDGGVPHARARAPALALSELYHSMCLSVRKVVLRVSCHARGLPSRVSLSCLVSVRLVPAGWSWVVWSSLRPCRTRGRADLVRRNRSRSREWSNPMSNP